MNLLKLILVFFLIPFVLNYGQSSNNISAQGNSTKIPHLEKHGTAERLIVNGKPMLLLAGELHNSTCGGFASMKHVWKRLAKKNLNAVVATVSWELIEPEQGKFDLSLVDSMIAGARQANLKLVLIWFGSWKNAGSVYIPSWVKKNYEKYTRAEGANGKPLEILSTFCKASEEADANAFAKLMGHIKKVDEKRQTVVMMQVENEMGVLDNMETNPRNACRDFSSQANKAFNSEVPKKFIGYLIAHKNNLFPELYKVWKDNGFKTSGTWEEVFGKSKFKATKRDWQFYSLYTEELFMAWHYASYTEKVVEAGKKEYPIPMYVNAWLKQPFSYWPGKYPSGGPLPEVLDVWRAAAPSISFIAPDIYTEVFDWVCREYTRSGNPLFIPETIGGAIGAARSFYVFGEYGAGCFSPFGIDDMRYGKHDPLNKAYAVLNKMTPIILENQGEKTMKGFLVDSLAPVQMFKLGNYYIKAEIKHGIHPAIAGGLIIQTGPQEYIAVGKALDVYFIPIKGKGHVGVDAVDKGTFENGKWIPLQRLNGDEVHASTWDGTGLKFPINDISIQKISLYSYK